VNGTWKLPQGELTLKQQFQMLSGTLRTAGKSVAFDGSKVRGDEIVFTADGVEYKGKVNGNRMLAAFMIPSLVVAAAAVVTVSHTDPCVDYRRSIPPPRL
jgi:hypothetical protein